MKRNTLITTTLGAAAVVALLAWAFAPRPLAVEVATVATGRYEQASVEDGRCLLYTSHAPDERSRGDLGGRRVIKKKKTH